MDFFFIQVTWLGSVLLLFPSAIAITFMFKRAFPFPDTLLFWGGLLGSSLIAHVLKILISRPRPIVAQEMIVSMPADFSFPSAHTAQVTSFFLSLALIVTRDLPMKISAVVWSISGLTILTVAFSRIYLKVHYVSDVIAGAALGIFWVFLLQWLIHQLF